MGQKNEDTERILPLLHRLLDCVPGTSLSDDVDERYVNGMTIFRLFDVWKGMSILISIFTIPREVNCCWHDRVSALTV